MVSGNHEPVLETQGLSEGGSVETLARTKPPVENPDFQKQRSTALAQLEAAPIDPPMVGLISGLSKLPYCFTQQSCYGHFLYGDQLDPGNTVRLSPSDATDSVEYRIAYVALCIDNCDQGRSLLQDLESLTSIDPDYVQCGCAGWFWQQQVNSYALQVEPDRFKTRDVAVVKYQEALHVQQIRDTVLSNLGELVDLHLRAL